MALRPARILTSGLIAVTLAGCGSTAATRPSRLVRVGVTEYRIRPASLSALAGKVTIEVTNFGRLTHDLSIIRGTTSIASTPDIPPGATRSLRATLPAGTYTVDSNVTDDDTLGMHGTLHVRARP